MKRDKRRRISAITTAENANAYCMDPQIREQMSGPDLHVFTLKFLALKKLFFFFTFSWSNNFFFQFVIKKVQWNLDLRKPDLRKNLNLRKIVGTTDFSVNKLFDLRKIF